MLEKVFLLPIKTKIMSKIVLKKKKNPFVIMSKTALNDKCLSWKAKGIIAYLLSLPEDWKVYIEDLKNRSKNSRDSTRSGVNELIKAGYIHRKPLKRTNGQFAGYEYYIYEEPTSHQPKTENPTSVNPTLQIKDNNKILNDTNKLSNDFEKNGNLDFEIFNENSYPPQKPKQKSFAKKEKVSQEVLTQLTKFNNHMISKKGKKWYTDELREAQLDYVSNLKLSYTESQIIESIKEAIRNSYVTFNPEYSINRQKNFNNGKSNNDKDIYTSFGEQLFDNNL
jgi:hypothetical protein